MNHIYKDKKAENTLCLLHGTGGNEYDLIGLAEHIDPTANILSIRGNVSENGMARFFKRLSFGVFDMDSLKEETKTLFDFIIDSSKQYQFSIEKLTIVGFSNGANILAYMLMQYEFLIDGAVMMHPMVPSTEKPKAKNQKSRYLITAGKFDQMVPIQQSNALFEMLKLVTQKCDIHFFDSGHNISNQELDQIKKWYKKELY
jgi:phospholipase/carboxylesterase